MVEQAETLQAIIHEAAEAGKPFDVKVDIFQGGNVVVSGMHKDIVEQASSAVIVVAEQAGAKTESSGVYDGIGGRMIGFSCQISISVK